MEHCSRVGDSIGGGKVPFQHGKHTKGRRSKAQRYAARRKHITSLHKRQAQRRT